MWWLLAIVVAIGLFGVFAWSASEGYRDYHRAFDVIERIENEAEKEQVNKE